MIVREEADGSLILVNQTDHAKISGLFASRWCNDAFERPRPHEAAVRAAMFYDCGWYAYETGPRLDPASGKALNFMQVPLDKPQLNAFQWATNWLTGIDPYAGLLINRHRTGLWRGRLQRTEPIEPQPLEDTADGGWRDADLGGDLLAGEALPAQRLNDSTRGRCGLAWR